MYLKKINFKNKLVLLVVSVKNLEKACSIASAASLTIGHFYSLVES